MKALEFDEAAWTPELGGIFTDLKLKIKPHFQADRRKRWYSMAKMSVKGSVIQDIEMDGNQLMNPDQWLDLIVDWKNFVSAKDNKPIPCTPGNVKKYLAPLLEENTGQPIDELTPLQNSNDKDINRYSLSGFISEFSGNIENYEKN